MNEEISAPPRFRQVRRAATRMLVADLDAPDARTTLADLRTALCLAGGASPDEIDPTTGHWLGRPASTSFGPGCCCQ